MTNANTIECEVKTLKTTIRKMFDLKCFKNIRSVRI